MHSSYYEAILQVRPAKHELEQFIVKALENADVYLSKRKAIKTGIDYYISSWKFATALGNKLMRKFGGKVEVSKKIYGRNKKKGKIVYRCTVLYRSPEHIVGEVVASGNKILRVTSVGKKNVGLNLATGKKEIIGKGDWEKISSVSAHISKDYPSLEVLDPEDYQTIPVENQKKVSGIRARVVIYKGKAYLSE